jgi:hypothetical protein
MKKITGLLSALFFLSCPAALAQNQLSFLMKEGQQRITCPINLEGGEKIEGLLLQAEIPEGVYYVCMTVLDWVKNPAAQGKDVNFETLLPVEQSAVEWVQKLGGQSNVIRVVTPKQ